jgi:hypothetical protein
MTYHTQRVCEGAFFAIDSLKNTRIIMAWRKKRNEEKSLYSIKVDPLSPSVSDCITVHWTAPADHNPKDFLALFKDENSKVEFSCVSTTTSQFLNLLY